MSYLVSGTVAGALFAISALALVLTYKTSRIFNFAQGGEAYFIAYVYYTLVAKAHWAPVFAVPVAVIGCGGALGFFLWWALFRHLTRATPTVRLTATIGLQVAIVAATQVIFGNKEVLRQVGIVRGHSVVLHIGGVGLNGNQLWVLASGAVIAVVAAVVMRRTGAGILLRGVVDSEEMSAGLGTNPGVVNALSWMAGTMIVALTGILLVPVLGLDPSNYQTLIAASFAAAVVGRLSSLGITFVAGLAIGIIQSVLVPILPATGVLGTGLSPSIPFIVILVALICWGLLGKVPPETAAVRGSQAEEEEAATKSGRGRWDRYVGWGVVAFLIFGLPHTISAFWLGTVAGSVSLAIVLLSWRVITGEAGVISLAQASLAGLGASFAAKSALSYGMPTGVAILFGAVVATAIGLTLGLAILPLGPLYAALATFAFGLFADNLIFQTNYFNQYDSGLPMSRPKLGPISLHSTTAFFYFAIVVFAIVALLLRNLRDSRTGMILATVRSAPTKARVLGINLTSSRLLSFAIASFIAGLGGAIYASYQNNAFPDSFATPIGLVWFAVVALTGVRSIGAAVASGIGLVLLPEILTRYANTTVANILPILFGLGAISLAKRPEGAASHLRATFHNLAVRLETVVTGSRAEATPPSSGVPVVDAERTLEATRPVALIDPHLDGAIRDVRPSRLASGWAGTVLEAKDVTVTFGGVRALNQACVRVPPGATVGVIGPNGAGKTTLLAVLSGLLRPQGGEILLDSAVVGRKSAAQLARLGISRTFQLPALVEDLTVAEHLLLAHRLRGKGNVPLDLLGFRSRRPSTEERFLIGGVLTQLGLAADAEKYPRQLPLGAQRLTEVGQSIVTQPRVLLLDEPSAGLDRVETAAFGRLLASLQDETGLSVVLVEHDLEFVLRMSDDVTVLDFGTVIAVGPAEDIRANADVRTAYVGAGRGEAL